MDEFEHIIYETVDGRARITLNRPAKRNALSVALLKELKAALEGRDRHAGDGRARVRGPETRDDKGHLL